MVAVDPSASLTFWGFSGKPNLISTNKLKSKAANPIAVKNQAASLKSGVSGGFQSHCHFSRSQRRPEPVRNLPPVPLRGSGSCGAGPAACAGRRRPTATSLAHRRNGPNGNVRCFRWKNSIACFLPCPLLSTIVLLKKRSLFPLGFWWFSERKDPCKRMGKCPLEKRDTTHTMEAEEG